MDMDAGENQEHGKSVKDIPPVPIKTYKWEDVRRAKLRGHYPYTHLTKDPFNEDIDPDEYKMDTKSKLIKSTSGVEIQEIIDSDKKEENEGTKINGKETEGIVESADSSADDNISQYLDRDEKTIEEIPSTSKEDNLKIKDNEVEKEKIEKEEIEKDNLKIEEDNRTNRAKSEEPKRKRKLSIESAYSRISLPKFGVMKKLRAAKEKLKLPKFNFSKSEPKLNEEKKKKKDKSSKDVLKQYVEPKKTDDKPVYIHIPLKPPPGQTDEFSYLEFEDPTQQIQQPPKQEEPKEIPTESKPSSPQNGITNDVQFIFLTAPSDDEVLDDHVMIPDSATSNEKKFFNGKELKELKTLAKGCIDEITPNTQIDGIIFEDVIQVEYVDEHNNPIGTTETSNFLEINEETLPTIEKKLSQRNILEELQKEVTSSMDSINKLVRNRSLRSLNSSPNRSRSNEALKQIGMTQEAPELSSLPSVSGMKKTMSLKENRRGKDFGMRGKKDEKKKNLEGFKEGSKDEPKEESKDTSKDKSKDTSKEISKEALKEISKEASKEKSKEVSKDTSKDISKEESKEASKYTSKEKSKLTSKEDQKEKSNIKEEKMLVDEEDGLKISEEAMKLINEELAKENQPKTTESQLKSSLSEEPLKKKVSFRRKSKQDDPDGVYEDVKVTNGKDGKSKDIKVMDSGQSMSVDEEKTYLDDKIIKSTSLEEDYNKWSKITDHEYEPINPPGNEIAQDGKFQDDKSQDFKSQDLKNQDFKSQDVKEVKEIKSSLKKPTSIRIPLHEDVIVQEPQTEDFQDQPSYENSTPSSSAKTPEEGQKNKFQEALRNQAGKIRTKFKNIKKPQNLDKLKIKKPKINVPKLPDTVKVNLPSFTLPKKTTIVKTTTKHRQYSTESNVGGTKKKFFDFSTYPRIFKKKDKDKFDDLDVTLPRKKDSAKKDSPKKSKDSPKKSKDSPKKSKDSPKTIRIPLHSEESMDREDLDLSSHRYDEDIEMENDYVKESQELHRISKNTNFDEVDTDLNKGKNDFHFNNDLSRNRWKHGTFHGENLHEIDQREDFKVTDLDVDQDISQNISQDINIQDFRDIDIPQDIPQDVIPQDYHQNLHQNIHQNIPQDIQQDIHQDINLRQDLNTPQQLPQDFTSGYRSVSSSGDLHRRGVVEEIDSDEFFLREKGISQDNIQIGEYLTSQIKETFKPSKKIKADDSFESEIIQEAPKKRTIKKPKRKKTPNVSREQITYDHESEIEEKVVEPIRPKRKPKKKKEEDKEKEIERDFDYQHEDLRRAVSDNILSQEDEHHFYDGDFRKDFPQMYENEQMEGIEQPNILLSDPYEKENILATTSDFPEAPPRKQKSLKSLVSEHDSIIDEITYANQNKEIEAYRVEHEYIIPTPEEPPQRPSRTRSRTRSQSRTNQSEREVSEVEHQLKLEDLEQQLPQSEEPCVEEPCVQTICDYMGYAIIDKSKQKDPPLPPRKKRSPTDGKFFTCPRPPKSDVPIRPMRNYSTLVPKSKSSERNGKENIDIGQYIEIEDEEGHSRLQSGDVVKKMKDRPLPAPPRPPRKTKEQSKSPLSDITNLNLDDEKISMTHLEENEVSVQTEPLPEGFICEELVEEKGDKVITPRQRGGIKEFEHQETITHGALVVAPIPQNFQEGPITQFSKQTEKIITVRREFDEDLKPEERKGETKIIERIIEKPLDEVKVLKAQKLQVEDLDVNRLTVNELLASKIKVSEIEGDSMRVSEINPEGGNVIVGGVELSGTFLKGLIDKLQSQKEEERRSFNEERKHKEDVKSFEKESKKKFEVPQELESENFRNTDEEFTNEELTNEETKNEEFKIEEFQQEDNIKTLTRDEAKEIANDILSDILQELSTTQDSFLLHQLSQNEQKKTPIEEPPTRPPRHTQKIREEMKQLEEEILQDDPPELTPNSTPPPRPPQPHYPTEFQETCWSQPPPSFYMLRSPLLTPFIEEDIPSPPRRKRTPKLSTRQRSESSSEDNPPPRTRRHRTPEPSIPQLAAQLTSACLLAGDKAFKRLLKHVTANVLRNSDGRQDMHVTVVILLVLIAGLILLGSGGGTTVHMHHWEYFNPPRDI